MGQLPSYPKPDPITPSKLEDFLRSSVVGGYIEQHFAKLARTNLKSEREIYENVTNKMIQYITNNKGTQSIKQLLLQSIISTLSDKFNQENEYNNIFSHLDNEINRVINSESDISECLVQDNFKISPIANTYSMALQIFNEIKPSTDFAEEFINALHEICDENVNYNQINPDIFLSIERHYRQIFSQPEFSGKIVNAIATSCLQNKIDLTGYLVLLYHLLQHQELSEHILSSLPQTLNDADEGNSTNNLSIRVRLGENSKITSVCSTNNTIYALASGNKLYSIDMNSKVVNQIIEDQFLENGTLCATNNLICATTPKESTFILLMEKQCDFKTAETVPNAVISCFSMQKTDLLVLTSDNQLYSCNEDNKTLLGHVDAKDPICMHNSNDILTIITKTETLIYEIYPNLIYLKLLSRKVLDYQENIVSIDSKYYIALLAHRSYTEFIMIPRHDGPYVNTQDFSRELISQPYTNAFHESIRRIINLMPLNYFVNEDNSKYFRISSFSYDYCITILNILLSITLPAQLSFSILHSVLSIVAGIVKHFDITEKQAKEIHSTLSSLAITKFASKQSIIFIMSYIMSTGFEKIYRKRIPEFISLIKTMSSDSTKISLLTNCIPIFLSSPAIVYIDQNCIKKIPEKMKYSVQKKMIFYCAQEIEKGTEDAINALHSCLPSDLSNLIFFFSILSSKHIAQYSTVFLDQVFPIIKNLIDQIKPIVNEFTEEEPLVRASPHPIRESVAFSWEVEINDAKAIEVKFDSRCCLIFGSTDFMKVSGQDGLVYQRNYLTKEPFPSKVLVNGSKAVLTVHSHGGESVYGITAYFRGIGKDEKARKYHDIMSFYVAYLLHRTSLCFCEVFLPNQKDENMKHCDFLLNSRKLTLLPDGLKQFVAPNVMDLLYQENKSQIKVKDDEKEIERMTISAVLNQLEIINIVLKMKSPHMMVTPPSTPKKTSKTPTLQKTMKNLTIKNKASIILPISMSKKITNPLRQTQPNPLPKSDNFQMEEFISFMMKELYKMRSKIRYNRQKGAGSSYLNEVLKKSEHFSNCRSVFEESKIVNDDRKNHCIDLMRLIGSDTPLNTIISYTNQYINKLSAQQSVSNFLAKFVTEIENKKFFGYLFYPLFTFLLENGKTRFKTLVANNFYKVFAQIDSLKEFNELMMLSVLTEIIVFGSNSQRSKELMKMICASEKTHLERIFLEAFCSNLSYSCFYDNYQILLENGFVSECLQCLSIFSQSFEMSEEILMSVSPYFAFKTPIELESFYLLLGNYFANKGFVNYSIPINDKIYNYQDFFKLLLKNIGLRLTKSDMTIINIQKVPSESQDYLMGVLISFFRTLLLSKYANDLLVLFDNIIFDYSKTLSSKLEVIAIFTIVGRGILPFSCGFCKVEDHPLKEVYRIAEITESEVTIYDNRSQEKRNFKKSKCFGSARISYSSQMFPATKFRANFIMTQLLQPLNKSLLQSTIALFALDIVQNNEWLGMLSSVSDNKILDTAIKCTNEIYFHSIPELMQGCQEITKSAVLSKLVRQNKKLLIGDGFVKKSDKIEMIYKEGMEKIGFLGSLSTNEYQNATFIDFKQNSLYMYGNKFILYNHKFENGDKISMSLFDNSKVTFWINDKEIEYDCNINDYKVTLFAVSIFDFDIKISQNQISQNQKSSSNSKFDEPVFFDDNFDDDDGFVQQIKSNYQQLEQKQNIKIEKPISDDYLVAARKFFFTSNNQKIVNFTKPKDPYKVIYKGSKFYDMTGRLISQTDTTTKLEFVDKLFGEIETEELPTIGVKPLLNYILPLFVSETIYNIIVIRCIRFICLHLQIYDNEKSSKLVQSLCSSIISTNYKIPNEKNFSSLLTYFQNCVKQIPDFIKQVLSINFEDNRQFYFTFNSPKIEKQRFVNDVTFNSNLTFGFYFDDEFKVTGTDYIRVNSGTKAFFIKESSFGQGIEEQKNLQLKVSLFNRKSDGIRFSFCPIFKFGTYSNQNQKTFIVNLIYSLTELIGKSKISSETKQKELCLSLFDFYSDLILSEDNVLSYAAYQNYWHISSTSNILDVSRPSEIWFGNHFSNLQNENSEFSRQFIFGLAMSCRCRMSIIPDLSTTTSLARIEAYLESLQMNSNTMTENVLLLMSFLNSKASIPFLYDCYLYSTRHGNVTFQVTKQDETFVFSDTWSIKSIKSVDGSSIPSDMAVEITKMNDFPNNNKLHIYAVKEEIPNLIIDFDIPQNIEIQKYIQLNDEMSKNWSKNFDKSIAELTGELKMISEMDKLRLEEYPNAAVKEWRSYLILRLNMMLNKLVKTDLRSPTLRPLLHEISYAIEPQYKYKQIDHVARQNITEKPTLNFSRTAAALVQTNPNSPHAISLFDQVISQVSPEKLSSLKNRNAPWIADLVGEGAIDAGGPGRDVFSEICQEMFLPFNKVFIQTPRTRAQNQMCEFIPDPDSSEERLLYAGAFVALCFVTQSPQPLKLNFSVWKYLTGNEISDQDLLDMDPDFAASLNVTGQRPLSIISLSGNKIDLIPFCDQNSVDSELYNQLAMEYRRNEFNFAMKSFRKGFEIIMEKSCRELLSPDQLKYIFCGPDEISAAQFISLLRYLTVADSASKEYFEWSILMMTSEERSMLLKFITGRVSIPVSGSGSNFAINVHLVKLQKTKPPYSLPTAATCSSTITVPAYPSNEIMLECLRKALRYGSDFTLDTQLDATTRAFE
ncbi:hypothetical protein TVAG_380220 [Trichomonas vaginalis G3]|uniref:HECT domain-containing protein n=1 Tax=Trichomonas vaginalis (strain ATCC PRA-98 / G3) TaxID=412133 RepID=A2DXG0_TRIV3|nr:guanyl-nucleotide exchange factor protein [Trichomonas vaginalis G3]EAY14912.1 hypothetical protein TVAG_380220 [Trichomonas vaginalis G3]KAI5485420.1 guanyl-nucleotide exchange factor protein [Trichomonas vaginalis G3]|eukprot:XP_001327135.1 hypothetical protein [Trichomonas vaginalis G3]